MSSLTSRASSEYFYSRSQSSTIITENNIEKRKMLRPDEKFKFYESFQKASDAGYVVIGAGLPRTGTTTTRHALGVLLDGKCHHMYEVFMGDVEKGANSTSEAYFWFSNYFFILLHAYLLLINEKI